MSRPPREAIVNTAPTFVATVCALAPTARSSTVVRRIMYSEKRFVRATRQSDSSAASGKGCSDISYSLAPRRSEGKNRSSVKNRCPPCIKSHEPATTRAGGTKSRALPRFLAGATRLRDQRAYEGDPQVGDQQRLISCTQCGTQSAQPPVVNNGSGEDTVIPNLKRTMADSAAVLEAYLNFHGALAMGVPACPPARTDANRWSEATGLGPNVMR